MVPFSCTKNVLQLRNVYSTLVYLLHCLPLKSSSHFSICASPPSFTVNFLVNSCGLTLEKALTTAKRCNLEAPARPDTVLTLLRKRGFTSNQITELVMRHPIVLVTPVSKLKPIIKFFRDSGLCSSKVAELIVSNPVILQRDLKSRIIPSVVFLKTLFYSNDAIFEALNRWTWLFSRNIQKDIAANVSFLQKIGVPTANISKLLSFQVSKLVIEPGSFERVVRKTKELGFDTHTPTIFVDAICAMRLSESTWAAKHKVYKLYGWSESEFLSAFLKQPLCMLISSDKINTTMEFLVNKLKLKAKDVSNIPNLLLYSLEKRIIPRCTVLQVLAAENRISKEQLNLLFFQHFIQMSESIFLKTYVVHYQEEVPQVLAAYKGQVEFLGFQINP